MLNKFQDGGQLCVTHRHTPTTRTKTTYTNSNTDLYPYPSYQPTSYPCPTTILARFTPIRTLRLLVPPISLPLPPLPIAHPCITTSCFFPYPSHYPILYLGLNRPYTYACHYPDHPYTSMPTPTHDIPTRTLNPASITRRLCL